MPLPTVPLPDRPIDVEESDFDATVLACDVPVLIDFHAQWCAPCDYVVPLLDELARTYRGRLLVAKIDTDAAQAVAHRYRIRSIPTLVLLDRGTEVARSLGFEPERVRAFVEEAVA